MLIQQVRKQFITKLYPVALVTPVEPFLMDTPDDVLVFDDAMLEKYWNGLAKLDENDNLVDDEEAIQKRDNEIKKQTLQGQIDSLEKEAGPRPFRDYMINTVKDYGAVTEAYPNGKIKDIDDMITELRKQINELG